MKKNVLISLGLVDILPPSTFQLSYIFDFWMIAILNEQAQNVNHNLMEAAIMEPRRFT